MNKIIKTKKKTLQKTDSLSPLRTKLKACDPEIQNYVIALEKENLKLQKQIAKLQAENVTFNNRIKVLEAEQYRPKVEFIQKGLFDRKVDEFLGENI